MVVTVTLSIGQVRLQIQLMKLVHLMLLIHKANMLRHTPNPRCHCTSAVHHFGEHEKILTVFHFFFVSLLIQFHFQQTSIQLHTFICLTSAKEIGLSAEATNEDWFVS